MINIIKACQPAQLYKLDVSSYIKPVSKLDQIIGQYKFEPNISKEVFDYLYNVLRTNENLKMTQQSFVQY